MNFINYNLAKKLYKISNKVNYPLSDYPEMENMYSSISNILNEGLEEAIKNIKKLETIQPLKNVRFVKNHYLMNESIELTIDKHKEEKVKIIILSIKTKLKDVKNIEDGIFTLDLRINLEQKRIEKVNFIRKDKESPFDIIPKKIEGYYNNGNIYKFAALLKILYENIADQANRTLKDIYSNDFNKKINDFYNFIYTNTIYDEKHDNLANENFIFNLNDLNDSIDLLCLKEDYIVTKEKNIVEKLKC